jgi:hypothetical protein
MKSPSWMNRVIRTAWSIKFALLVLGFLIVVAMPSANAGKGVDTSVPVDVIDADDFSNSNQPSLVEMLKDLVPQGTTSGQSTNGFPGYLIAHDSNTWCRFGSGEAAETGTRIPVIEINDPAVLNPLRNGGMSTTPRQTDETEPCDCDAEEQAVKDAQKALEEARAARDQTARAERTAQTVAAGGYARPDAVEEARAAAERGRANAALAEAALRYAERALAACRAKCPGGSSPGVVSGPAPSGPSTTTGDDETPPCDCSAEEQAVKDARKALANARTARDKAARLERTAERVAVGGFGRKGAIGEARTATSQAQGIWALALTALQKAESALTACKSKCPGGKGASNGSDSGGSSIRKPIDESSLGPNVRRTVSVATGGSELVNGPERPKSGATSATDSSNMLKSKLESKNAPSQLDDFKVSSQTNGATNAANTVSQGTKILGGKIKATVLAGLGPQAKPIEGQTLKVLGFDFSLPPECKGDICKTAQRTDVGHDLGVTQCVSGKDGSCTFNNAVADAQAKGVKVSQGYGLDTAGSDIIMEPNTALSGANLSSIDATDSALLDGSANEINRNRIANSNWKGSNRANQLRGIRTTPTLVNGSPMAQVVATVNNTNGGGCQLGQQLCGRVIDKIRIGNNLNYVLQVPAAQKGSIMDQLASNDTVSGREENNCRKKELLPPPSYTPLPNFEHEKGTVQ